MLSESLSHVSDIPLEVRGGEIVHQMSQKISQLAPLKDRKGELFPSTL